MTNQLLKLGALIATGRFFRQRWRGVLAVVAIWIVLWVVHGEYVQYVELSGDTRFVLHASMLKLVIYVLSIALYVWRVERPLWPKTPVPVVSVPAQPKAGSTQQPISLANGDDGFDFLRNKNRK